MDRLRTLAAAVATVALCQSPAAAQNTDVDAVIRAVLDGYASQHLRDAPRVCVKPEAPRTAFFPVRAGMMRIGIGQQFFRDVAIERAFRAIQPRSEARVRPTALPRNFRLDNSDKCRETLSLLAPAIVGDIAFVEVHHRHFENEFAGSNTRLIALRRAAAGWRIAETSHVVMTTN